jgi:hypothetical protein
VTEVPARRGSTELDSICAIADPVERLERLAGYIRHGEVRLEAARRLRAETVREARAVVPPVSWPVLVARAGATEAYLRREMKAL